MKDWKGTKNWRIRFANGDGPEDENNFFFVEGDLEKDNFYPRVEVMQEDFGEHKGYTFEIRLLEAKLIVDAGNTIQKCGLLPSEILEQRDELLKVLLDVKTDCDNAKNLGIENSLPHWLIFEMNELINKINNQQLWEK